MRICWLILAHANPLQFGRLVSAVESAGDHVVAHIDGKADIESFRHPGADLIHDRVTVQWGGWGMVEATLRMLRHARRTYPDADYYWLTSGDSYPVRSPSYIHSFLTEKPGVDFLNYLPMPAPQVKKPLTRVSNYYIEHDPRTSKFATGYKVLHRLMRRPYKSRMGGMAPYCGSQWFTFQAATVDYILERVDAMPEFVALCRTSRVPDEFFFHTLVVNRAGEHAIEPALFWADFRPSPLPRPPVIGDSQLQWMRENHLAYDDVYGQQDILLARKFADSSAGEVSAVEREFWPARAG